MDRRNEGKYKFSPLNAMKMCGR